MDVVEEQKKSFEAELRAMDLHSKLADDTIAGVSFSEAWVRTRKRVSETDEESKRHAVSAADFHKKEDKYY